MCTKYEMSDMKICVYTECFSTLCFLRLTCWNISCTVLRMFEFHSVWCIYVCVCQASMYWFRVYQNWVCHVVFVRIIRVLRNIYDYNDRVNCLKFDCLAHFRNRKHSKNLMQLQKIEFLYIFSRCLSECPLYGLSLTLHRSS